MKKINFCFVATSKTVFTESFGRFVDMQFLIKYVTLLLVFMYSGA